MKTQKLTAHTGDNTERRYLYRLMVKGVPLAGVR